MGIVPPGDHRARDTYVPAGFLMVLMALQATAQHSYGALAPFISDAFEASGSTMGLIGAALYCGTATAALLLGGWVDRRPPTVVMRVTLLGIAGSMVAVAAAPLVGIVIVGFLLVGLFRGVITPLGDRIAYEYTPLRTRGLVFGIKQTGAPLGSITAAMVLPPLAVTALGWRGAALVVAALLALASVASVRAFPAAVSRRRRSDASDATPGGHEGEAQRPTDEATASRDLPNDGPMSPGAPAPGLVRRLSAVLAFSAGLGAQLAVAMTFMTLFLVDVAEMDPVRAGRWFALFNVGGVAGRVTLGWLSDRLFLGRRTVLLLVSAVASGGMAILLGVAHPAVLAVPWGLGVALFGFFAQSWVGVSRVWGVELAGGGSSGRAGGLMLGAMMLGGLSGPVVFGWLLDVTGAYRSGWIAVGALACLTGASVLPAMRRERELATRGRRD